MDRQTDQGCRGPASRQDGGIVLLPGDINGLRATQMIQDNAQSEKNGESFSRAATPYWIIWVTPFGRAVNRSSTVFRLLARTLPFPARRALRPNDSRLAEPINVTGQEYCD